MNKYIVAVALGVAGWIIGYLAGIPLIFYSQGYIHTAESVLMAFFGMVFAAWYFFRLKGDYMKEGLVLGIIWLALMWVLDYMFLLPLMNGDFSAYFASIGFGYLAIPINTTIFGWAIGRLARKK